MGAGRWFHLFEFKFWSRWIKEPLGFGLDYVLGDNFEDFLRYPLLDGRPSYLVWLLQWLITVSGGILLLGAAWRLCKQRRRLANLAIGSHSPTAFTQNAALWGFGILLTASGLYVHRHYLAVTFPLQFVWLARLALAQTERLARSLNVGRILLLTLCLSQFLLTAHFLEYIHLNQGAKNGDYGLCYGAMQHPRAQSTAARNSGKTLPTLPSR
jgi:hypothetical protein